MGSKCTWGLLVVILKVIQLSVCQRMNILLLLHHNNYYYIYIVCAFGEREFIRLLPHFGGTKVGIVRKNIQGFSFSEIFIELG